jgi:hypothetical protein
MVTIGKYSVDPGFSSVNKPLEIRNVVWRETIPNYILFMEHSVPADITNMRDLKFSAVWMRYLFLQNVAHRYWVFGSRLSSDAQRRITEEHKVQLQIRKCEKLVLYPTNLK